jgi:hypothetical protein
VTAPLANVDDDDYAAFELRGAVLGLFPVDKLAADGRGDPEPGRGGVRFTKEPVSAAFFEGRSAHVADPKATTSRRVRGRLAARRTK